MIISRINNITKTNTFGSKDASWETIKLAERKNRLKTYIGSKEYYDSLKREISITKSQIELDKGLTTKEILELRENLDTLKRKLITPIYEY